METVLALKRCDNLSKLKIKRKLILCLLGKGKQCLFLLFGEQQRLDVGENTY